ncbi:badf type atpase domain-containing protein [Anaeramoeba ignava]|uniref:N-acetyl-D-glucosamine kinase n=1 Tax=Anaeramoeba ignava TaxID=1746090 RepID=A0A9Q0LRP2_ANAIG|nr:badf type atpase domain-containing protein [Anaeramoeba ignava]
MTKFIGGIDGGATNSTMVIMKSPDGEIIARVTGGPTNQFLDFEGTVSTIIEMTKKAKEQANIPSDQLLDSLGLSLSGLESEKEQNRMKNELSKYGLSSNFYLCNDSFGSLATAFQPNTERIVVISGTGSVCRMIDSSGKVYRVGGWGHVLGDEGSSYYVAMKAVKSVIRFLEKNVKEKYFEYDHSVLIRIVFEYFQIHDINELLDIFYRRFSKNYVAGLTKYLSQELKNQDPLCSLIFKKAAKQLARMILAVLKQRGNDLEKTQTQIQILCCGSMWNNFTDFQNDFLKNIRKGIKTKIKFVQLTDTSAIGSCLLAAHEKEYPLNFNHSSAIRILYEEK